jgi:hypothetical protein
VRKITANAATGSGDDHNFALHHAAHLNFPPGRFPIE